MRTRTALASLLLPLAVGCGVGGDAAVREIDWRETAPASGTVVGGAVEVRAEDQGGTFPLVAIEDPDVGGTGYAIVGEVRYEGVEGQGFLEMWSQFPDGGRYFSRTLAEAGPLAWLSGSSDWRRFELPFLLEGATSLPERLEIGVVLPGEGTVGVSGLRLVALDGAAAGAEGGWWSDRTAGLIGAAGGSLLGMFGAAIGSLIAVRRARSFVLGALAIAVGVGTALLAAAAVALLASQPYAVWFPLLLGGAILVAVCGPLMSAAKRAYAEAELRRMRARDLG